MERAGRHRQRWRARLQDVALDLVLSVEGEPVGMVGATAPEADGAVKLISLWVVPAARGRDVGDEVNRLVLTEAASEHPESPVLLSVKTGNVWARRLCERHGFIDTGPVTGGPRGKIAAPLNTFLEEES